MKTWLYSRVSTDEQGNGLDLQTQRLTQEAQRRGWEFEVREEHASGKSIVGRPIFSALLRELKPGDRLMVTSLTRLSRSVVDFARLLDLAARGRWSLMVVDMDLDTSTAMGQVIANVLMAFSQYERQLIVERTKAGMAQVKARGVQLGHPSTVPPDVKERIRQLRARGLPWRVITDQLNAAAIPGPAGGRWYPTSVRRHCG